MIYLWLTSIIIWIIFAYFDSKFEKKEDYHFASALFTCLVAFLFPFTMVFLNTDIVNYYEGVKFAITLTSSFRLSLGLICLLLIKICSIPFIILTIKWIVFDPARNKFMGQDYFYYGDNPKPVARGNMDRMFGKYQFIIKWILLILSIILSIYY